MFRIIAFTILAAIVYGILHDQVTARVCIEYFTIGHPILIPTDSPFWIAMVWGVVATWWMGLILGIPLAFIARLGSRPKLEVAHLVKPTLVLLLVMGSSALFAGMVGFYFIKPYTVLGDYLLYIPVPKQQAFVADWLAHSASYLVGMAGGIGLWIYTWRKRQGLERKQWFAETTI